MSKILNTEKLKELGENSDYLQKPTIEIYPDGSGLIVQRDDQTGQPPLIENFIFEFESINELKRYLEDKK